MRIHSNVLTAEDIRKATTARGMKGVRLDGFTTHGSRKRERAFEVKLTGNSSHRPNGGTRGANSENDEYAAQWDEWGIFLEELYTLDPDMVTPYYKDWEDFGYQTAWRFENLTAEQTHKRHKWEFAAPRQFTCKCGAALNR